MSYVRREFPIPGNGFGRMRRPDKDEIWEATKVSPSLRKRRGWNDRVLVLSKGTVAEYDAPLALLEQSGGAFRRLAEGTGDLDGLVRLARGGVGS